MPCGARLASNLLSEDHHVRKTSSKLTQIQFLSHRKLAVSLSVLALCAAVSWGHHISYQGYETGGQAAYQDVPGMQDHVPGIGESPSQVGGDTFTQQDEFDDGGEKEEEGMREQQEEVPFHAKDGAIQDDDDDEDEEEEQKAYLMGEDDSEVEEMVAGEFYEGPSNSFVEMEDEEVPPEDDEDLGIPTGQHHFKIHRLVGKRSAEDDTLSDLEGFLQQKEGEGGVVYGGDAIISQRWNNKLHGPVSVQCSAGFGLYQMQSVFNTNARDRQFLFKCKRVSNTTL